MVEALSEKTFEESMEGLDLPIYSNVLTFIGNDFMSLDIMDVYRPKPEANMR